jgi:hypothetical protein
MHAENKMATIKNEALKFAVTKPPNGLPMDVFCPSAAGANASTSTNSGAARIENVGIF